MKSFFKTVFASMLGFILGSVLLIFLVIAIVGAIASSAGKKDVEVKDSSVLLLSLKHKVEDRGTDDPFADFDFSGFEDRKKVGLNEITAALDKARTDSKIKGVLIDLDDVNAGFATSDEIRNAITEFKKSGKFVYSYAETYSQKAYFIGSAAEKVFIHPTGGMDFKGLSAEILFLKKALEKLQIEPQVIRHGQFKSAIEPLILEKMSEANRKQTQTYLNSIWNYVVTKISESRKVSQEELNRLADGLEIRKPEDALKYKLVDHLYYRDQVYLEIKKKTGLKEDDKINFISVANYYDAVKDKVEGGTRIAVIYARGDIKDGDADSDEIGSLPVSKTIREARLNKNVKAIVLRVNSPGGSALASDVIWRELTLAKKVKPVVVSMGDVAASGGYYISCPADRIFASPVTITGSIGVFGVLFNGGKFFEEKLGVTVDTVKTNDHSDLGSVFRPLTAKERDVVQASVEDVYATFIGKVGQGRKMTTAEVDSIGQGRVWSGVDAKAIRLVDEFGGLNDAIAYAAGKAKLKDYKIQELPADKPLFERLVSDMSEEEETRIMQEKLKGAYNYYLHLEKLIQMKGVQARLPYEIEIY